MKKVREEDLLFEPVREYSPQWNVTHNGYEVLSSRFVTSPLLHIS